MMEDEPQAESSKAASARMRRLHRQPPSLVSNPQAAIHPATSQLIYPTSAHHSLQGYLVASAGYSLPPRLLPLPTVLTPAKKLSVSPSGEWIVFFHPNTTDNQGGTLAIYPQTILSPIAAPSTTVPFATFALDSGPLAVTHLYPPRTFLAHSRAPPQGPRPPVGHDDARGPTFVVLTTAQILLFYPRPVSVSSQMDGRLTWAMNVLGCPLFTVWHSTSDRPAPSKNDEKISRGWMAIVSGNEGVWAGWESKGRSGVVKANIGMDVDGRYFMQTIPMPALPFIVPPHMEGIEGNDSMRATLQGMVFIPLPPNDRVQIKDEDNVSMNEENGKKSTDSYLCFERIGVVLIYHDFVSYSQEYSVRLRFETIACERRQLTLAPGFSEISAGNGADTSIIYDWFSTPSPIKTVTSPPFYTMKSLLPIPSVPPHTLAIAVLSRPEGFQRVHIDLASDEWNVTNDFLINNLEGNEMNVVPSQGAERGQLGLCAIFGNDYPQLGVTKQLEGQAILGELLPSASQTQQYAAWTASSIILAERQGLNWSDVIRAASAIVPSSSLKDFENDLFERVFRLAGEEVEVDQLRLFLRVQIAIFSIFKDSRLELATSIMRLYEASELVSSCAIFEENEPISFDLDSIWPLISIIEWAFSIISDAIRETIALGATEEWEESSGTVSDDISSSILLLQPTLRALTLHVLSQLYQLIAFLSNLERPILQPENRILPAAIARDPMATIIAREQVKGIAAGQGINVEQWGEKLESYTGVSDQSVATQSLLRLSLFPLRADISSFLQHINESLSLSTSDLYRYDSPNRVDYDAIEWSPLPAVDEQGPKKQTVLCQRCGWRTEALTRIGVKVQGDSPWARWKRERERSCICGGTWMRKELGTLRG
ncbi:hypothetical protein L204_103080 [Cryptococcus depauperatus]